METRKTTTTTTTAPAGSSTTGSALGSNTGGSAMSSSGTSGPATGGVKGSLNQLGKDLSSGEWGWREVVAKLWTRAPKNADPAGYGPLSQCAPSRATLAGARSSTIIRRAVLSTGTHARGGRRTYTPSVPSLFLCSTGMHKAAQAVGLEEKPTSTKLAEVRTGVQGPS
jgi:hypothetical protein